MIIRRQQLEQLTTVAAEHFLARANAHIQRCFPGKLPPERRDANLREWIVRGQSYGLQSEWALIRYVDLSIALGEGFEERPEYAGVADILRNPDLNERSKISQAYTLVNDAVPPENNRERM